MTPPQGRGPTTWFAAGRLSPLRAAAAALALFALAAVVLRLVTPPVRLASVEIRTTFDGVERGTYPNGVPFSAEEFVAEPVLREVYKQRGLERVGEFDRFRTAFSVSSENPELARLDREALARFADVRLGMVERAKAEDDYRRSRASLMAQSKYVVTWRDPDGLGRLSDAELVETLGAVLQTWQRQVREVKRATQYNVPVLSQNVLDADLLLSEDYLVAADLLRAKIDRSVAMVDRLVRLPGAGTIRGGKRQLSLEELKARLQDLQRFEVTPLIVLAQSNALARDPVRLRAFLASRRQQARYEMLEASARVATLYNALVDYSGTSSQARHAESGSAPAPDARVPFAGRRAEPGGAADDVTAIIPQFGDTFFTRLAETASKSSDVTYRQKFTDRIVQERERLTDLRREEAYYQDLERAIAGRTGKPSPGAQREFDQRFARALAMLREDLDDVGAVYVELSKRNLDPLPALYVVTKEAVVRTESVLVMSRLVKLALLGAFVAFVLVLLWRRVRPATSFRLGRKPTH